MLDCVADEIAQRLGNPAFVPDANERAARFDFDSTVRIRRGPLRHDVANQNAHIHFGATQWNPGPETSQRKVEKIPDELDHPATASLDSGDDFALFLRERDGFEYELRRANDRAQR